MITQSQLEQAKKNKEATEQTYLARKTEYDQLAGQLKQAELEFEQAQDAAGEVLSPSTELLNLRNLTEQSRSQVYVDWASYNKAHANYANLDAAITTAKQSSNDPKQQKIIASQKYVDLTGQYRDLLTPKVTEAWSDYQDGKITKEEYEFVRNQLYNAEQEYLSAINGADETQSQVTAEIAETYELSVADEFDAPEQLPVNLEAANIPTIVDESEALDELVVKGSASLDRRIRIRPQVANRDTIYGVASDADRENVLMAPLRETNGVLFPYTPVITYEHSVNYSQMAPMHANTDYYIYNNTPAVKINIEGQFTAQTPDEARYMAASMHFFRTVTKMRFGENTPNRGAPPPVVLLSGYGDIMFNDLPVIITGFSMQMPNNINYVMVDVGGHETWLPTLTTFTVQCVVQQTPRKHREDFQWDEFASGKLLDNKGWI